MTLRSRGGGAAAWVLGVAVAALFLASEAAAVPVPHDYEEALRKSLLYFEAQRSGRLPHGQRVAWRDHSGLTDGLEQGVRASIINHAVSLLFVLLDDPGADMDVDLVVLG